MSHEPLHVLRARAARTRTPHDVAALVEASLREGELVTLAPGTSDPFGLGTLLHQKCRYLHVADLPNTDMCVWKQVTRTHIGGEEHTNHLEWGLMGWRLAHAMAADLWSHDQPVPNRAEWGDYRVETHTPIREHCAGEVLLLPSYLIDTPPGMNTSATGTTRSAIRPHHPQAPSPVLPADFGSLLTPWLRALTHRDTTARARYLTLRLLATLLFDANGPRRGDDPLVTIRHDPAGTTSFSCDYDGIEGDFTSTSTLEYEATLELQLTPDRWFFSRLITSRDIYFGIATS